MIVQYTSNTEKPILCEALFRLDEDYPDLNGHFEAFPILPGASQVGLVVTLLERRWQRRVVVQAVAKAKFRHMLTPGVHVKIRIEEAGTQMIFWRIFNDEFVYSEGRLTYDWFEK